MVADAPIAEASLCRPLSKFLAVGLSVGFIARLREAA